MAEEKCKKIWKMLDKCESLCYNIKADWLNRSGNMRECWNRQTGTFEVRVSLTCGFKSHLSHQTPFRFWAVFFCAHNAKAVRISEPLFRLYSAVKWLQCAVWRRCLVYARGTFYQIKMRCRGQCPTDIRGCPFPKTAVRQGQGWSIKRKRIKGKRVCISLLLLYHSICKLSSDFIICKYYL